MPDVIFVNSDWSAVVPAGSREAAFGVQPRDAKRLGVDKLPVRGGVELPELPEPETAEAFVLRSASLTEEPETVPEPEPEPEPEPVEAKEAPKPADKAAAKPANKATKKPVSK